MKLKEVYIGNIALSLAMLVSFYLFKLPLFFWIAIAVLILTILSEKLASGIAFVLKQVYQFIGTINATIILTVFYFLVLTPLAFLVGLFAGKKKNINTNWKMTNKEYNFENLW